ncbi:MAG TPA: cation transporter [Elusimicrobia bacterium]|nr:cation transporter [Elusimicrobiota bacterium]
MNESAQPHRHNSAQANREKKNVALYSVGAAVVLTGTKLGIGLWTNSLGILSEAAHSGLDLLAAVVTYWAVSVSSRPADTDHTYGHGKVENLSALFETALLFATCVWIVWEAAERLFFVDKLVEVNIWSFLVITLSIIVDISRSRALRRTSEKWGSQALEADALHFESDIWSSSVVLIGLGCVLAAGSFNLPWLVKADSIAALGVAIIVVHACWMLGKKSVNDLLDAIPGSLHDKVASAARVTGVTDVLKTRVRRSGPEIFADVTLAVQRGTTFEKSHQIADMAEASVKNALPQADVVVHVEPCHDGDPDLPSSVRVLAEKHGLGAHSIMIYEEAGRRALELHLEVEGSLTVEEAHLKAEAFEQELKASEHDLAEITTHLEPARETPKPDVAETTDTASVAAALEYFPLPHGAHPHHIRARRTKNGLLISLHLALPAKATLATAHNLAGRIEDHLRSKMHDIAKVTIHQEPLQED